MKITRRQFLKACAQVTAGLTATGVGLYQYGTRIEAGKLTIEQIQIPIRQLKPAFEGFKIVQISDIHIDSFTEMDIVEKAVVITNSLHPDLIVLTGDYVSRKAEAILELMPAMMSLNAKHGIFASMGNHELWTNPTYIRTRLEKAGIPVLVNEGIPITAGKDKIYLAGIDDGWSGNADLRAALAEVPGNAPTILLAHEPDLADSFANDGRVALQLSGHSHGGQVRLPGKGAIILPPYGKKYDQGLYRVNDMWLYTNRGLGLGPVPYRINCPPEITEITLVTA